MKFIIVFMLSLLSLAVESKSSELEVLNKRSLEGDHEAMTELGYLYFAGVKVEKDLDRALKFYEKAAKKGNLQAMSNLCNMYLYGTGVKINIVEAWNLCREPARQGHTNAMVMMAEMARTSELKSYFKNDTKIIEFSFKMYEAAAMRGHAHAQFKLGGHYQFGFGTVKNLVKAEELYKQSLSQGNLNAKRALVELRQALKQERELEKN